MNKQTDILTILDTIGVTYGTLSTVTPEGAPQGAAMYFVYDDMLALYFMTKKNSRKFKNMEANPRVAFTVTSHDAPVTLQFEGTASIVANPREEERYFAKLVALASASAAMPPVAQMEGETVFMKIETSWARSGDFQIMKEGNTFIEAKE